MVSINKSIEKIRPPRVHIKYEVHVGNAIEKRELPFVVGVLADLSGDNKDKPKLKKRSYVEITSMTFDQVLARIKPSLKINVSNRIQDNDTELAFKMEFTSMDDFKPTRVAEKIAEKVKPFARTLELRRQIKKLLLTMDENDDVVDMFQRLINDRTVLKQLCNEADHSGTVAGEGQP